MVKGGLLTLECFNVRCAVTLRQNDISVNLRVSKAVQPRYAVKFCAKSNKNLVDAQQMTMKGYRLSLCHILKFAGG